MLETITKMPPSKFTSLSETPDLRSACILADILMDVFISDTVSLVEDGVRSECEQQANSRDNTIRAWAQRRLGALKIWRKHKTPLSYDALEHLTEAVVRDPRAVGSGLPMYSVDLMDHKVFGSLLTSYTSVLAKTSVKPPLSSEGSLRHVLPVALGFIHGLSNHSDPKEQDAFAAKVIAYVAHDRKICHIPWSSPERTEAGGVRRKVVFNYWRTLSTARQSVSQPFTSMGARATSPPLSPAKASAKRALMNDVNGEWDGSMLKVSELHSILHKRTLPTDWQIANLNLPDGYVKDTYHWVQTHIDFSKPVHQLALLVGILFSKVSPQVGYPDNTATMLRSLPPAKLTARIRQTEWIYPSRRSRASQDVSTNMMMLATTIIALAEPSSPLNRFADNNGAALGTQWTGKHSKCDCLTLPIDFQRGHTSSSWHYSIQLGPHGPRVCQLTSSPEVSEVQDELEYTAGRRYEDAAWQSHSSLTESPVRSHASCPVGIQRCGGKELG
jgi:hypothetical protein